LTFFTKTKWHS